MTVRIFRKTRRPKVNQLPLGPWIQGVNEKLEPHLLEFSELSDAKNVVVDENTGRLNKRPGSLFRSAALSSLLIDAPVRGFNFKKRDGTELLIVTDNKKIAFTRDLDTWIDITPIDFLTGGQFVAGSFSIDFAIAEDLLWITNGADPVFSWDGVVAGPSTDSMVAYDLGPIFVTWDAPITGVVLDGGDNDNQIIDPAFDFGDSGRTLVGKTLTVTAAADGGLVGVTRTITAYDDTLDKITFPIIVGLVLGDTISVGDQAADTQTEIYDSQLDRNADGTTWKGQIIVVTNSANQDNIGQVRSITAFDDALDKITFAKFTEDLADGDTISVGVAIPRVRYLKYHHNTMFGASTAINGEEVRFTDNVDPNEPTIRMLISNPNSWPQENQFEAGSGVGDRIWGFTNPVYRNRIAVFKSSGIYRIEPDPTFRFIPIAITEQFGSRFASTWQQHGEVLMFLGEDKDGRPDVYMTDFTTVRHFKRKHSKTLDNLRQPNAVSRSSVIASRSEFEAGTLSDTASADTNQLESKEQVEVLLASFTSNLVNIDILTDPEPHIIGHPAWDNINNFDASPVGWSVSSSSPSPTTPNITNFNGTANVGWDGSDGTVGQADRFIKYFKTLDDAVGSNDVLLRATVQTNGPPDLPPNFRSFLLIRNGAKSLDVLVYADQRLVVNGNSIANPVNNNVYNEYVLLLKSDGTNRLWINNVEIAIGAPFNDARKEVAFGTNFVGGSYSTNLAFSKSQFQYLNFNEDFKASALMPANLLDTGNFDFTTDFKKAPVQFNKNFFVGAGITALASSSSPDDIAYTAPLAYTSGQEPGVDNATPVDQFLRTNVTLTVADPEVQSANLSSYQGGILWLSAPIQIGADIRAWDVFQFDLGGSPASTVVRIRNATAASLGVLPSPDPVTDDGWFVARPGSDSEGWSVIADLNNIGTILGGVEDTPNPPFPDTKYIQIKIEFGVDATGEIHGTKNVVLNWLEGSSQFLSTMAIMFQKKWLLVAASQQSSINDTIVTVDSNRSFVNWGDLLVNFFVWFKGSLYAGCANCTDIYEIINDLKQDDDGPDGSGGRNIRPIQTFIETRQEIVGEIHQRKKARTLEAACNVENSDITFFAKRDIEPAFLQIGQVNFSATKNHQRINFNIGVQFKRLTIRAENNILNQDFGLEGMILVTERVPSRSGR